MTDKVLFINYGGYFLTANTFIPDNSISALANVLIHENIPCEVLDFHNAFDMGKISELSKNIYAPQVIDKLNNNLPLDDQLIKNYQNERKQAEAELTDVICQQILDKLENEKISLIAFKLWIGNGIKYTISIARTIKEKYPQIRLVGGGPAVQYMGQSFHKYSDIFDHLVYGEGEQAILDIYKNQTFDINSKLRHEHLDDLPFPTYNADVYPSIENFYKIRIIDDSRGCFNKCAFCCHSFITGQKSRTRSPKAVVDEMARLQKTEGVNHFRFSGSNPPLKFVKEVAQEIIDRNLKIYFSIFSSINNTKKEDLPLLYKGGLRAIFYGIESGDDTVLKKSHNKNNLGNKHVISICEAAMKENIFICLSFIYPSPFDNETSRQKTLDLLSQIFRKYNHGSVIILPPFLMPGSLWWDNMSKYGFTLNNNMTKEEYLLNMIDRNYDFLMPRGALEEMGFSLNGKSSKEIFSECQKFMEDIQRMGITTDFDDSAFMLAHMANTTPLEYKNTMINNLIHGNSQNMTEMVKNFNLQTSNFGTCPS